MISPFLHSALTLLGAGLVAAASPQSSAPDRVFPSVRADDLNGRVYDLPRDFEGERTLVFVGFAQEQQADIDTWVGPVQTLMADHPGLRWYEVPVAGSANRLFKPMIDAGMRAGIQDLEMRGRTITLFVDRTAFRRALGLSTEREIHALLLDSEGRVLWSAEGPFTPAKGRVLAEALASPTGD